MDQVVIGMDPHKASVTIEARDIREVLRATGRFGTDTGNYRQLLKVAHQWPGGCGRSRARTASAVRSPAAAG